MGRSVQIRGERFTADEPEDPVPPRVAPVVALSHDALGGALGAPVAGHVGEYLSHDDVTTGPQERLAERGRAGLLLLSEDTVTAAKKGDQKAWEAAYGAYGAALLGFLMLRLRHSEDARDALSETYLRAIDKANGFRGDALAFRSWLFRIARNVATDRVRSRDRLQPTDDLPERADNAEPHERLVAQEEAAQARAAFASLPAEDQELLWLRVCTGLSSDEVGRILGKRAGTVRMQQLRALEAMARRLPS